MNKDLTCIICPRGCALKVQMTENRVLVTGNACKKGEQYGIDECTHPVRTVTAVVRVSNRIDKMISVKTENPIPKEHILDLMNEIIKKDVKAPIEIGNVICDNIFGTRVIATKQIL